MYIVIEGQDSTGKDIQAQLLVEYFTKQGKTAVSYAESGTNSKSEFVSKIAGLNYRGSYEIEERTRVLLYLINRYEQWKKIAEPALRNGQIVITSRSWFSTLVYEGYGLGVSRSMIIRLHKELMPEAYFHPDRSVILTLDDATRQKRTAQTERSKEFFKKKDNAFQEKINHSYLKVAKEYEIPTLDTNKAPELVHRDLIRLWNI